MGLISIPDPVSIFESAKNSGLERDVINALISTTYSAWITAMWRSGDAKWAQWTGEGQAMKDAAAAVYLSLSSLQKKGFLTLTVPSDLLTADELSKFQTSSISK